MSASLAAKFRSFLAKLLMIVGESSWVLFVFFFVAGVVFGLLFALVPAFADFVEVSPLGQLLFGGLIYAIVCAVVVLPVATRRKWSGVKQLLGIAKKPGRSILWLPIAMWGLYMVVTIAIGALTQVLLPWVDVNQEQQVGFEALSQPYEYVAAFIALVVVPPLAEELLFRGYLFGRLRERFGFWLTAIVVSVVFGFVHGQWNVGIDVAVLSIFLCYLRERTGSIWAGVALHAIKNGIAYFFLFIGPLIGIQLL